MGQNVPKKKGEDPNAPSGAEKDEDKAGGGGKDGHKGSDINVGEESSMSTKGLSHKSRHDTIPLIFRGVFNTYLQYKYDFYQPNDVMAKVSSGAAKVAGGASQMMQQDD